ncbi:MAG: alpha/beta hydrolase [Coriobacteriales bacterium]|nr:alpha/beta hydrolase [Coriobacteriales bacterium]
MKSVDKHSQILVIALCSFIMLVAVVFMTACNNANSTASKSEEKVVYASNESKAKNASTNASKTSNLNKEIFETITKPQLYERESGCLTIESINSQQKLEKQPEEKIYGNVHVYTFNPKTKADKVFIYLHGGAYVYNAAECHVLFCEKLASKHNASVIMPLYPLAPQSQYQQSYDLLSQIYDEALEKNMPIFIAGDSAGGGLATGFILDLIEKNKKMPSGLIAISPWLDVTMSNPLTKDYESKDKMLDIYSLQEYGKMWSPVNELTNYKVSPGFGNVTNLCNTLVSTGTEELFYPDICDFYEKLKTNNNRNILVTGEGLGHIWPVNNSSVEQEKFLEIMAGFIKDCLK